MGSIHQDTWTRVCRRKPSLYHKFNRSLYVAPLCIVAVTILNLEYLTATSNKLALLSRIELFFAGTRSSAGAVPIRECFRCFSGHLSDARQIVVQMILSACLGSRYFQASYSLSVLGIFLCTPRFPAHWNRSAANN